MSFVKGLMPKMMAVRMYPSFWIPSKAITFINSAMNPFKVKNDSEGIHESKVSRLKGSSVKGSFKNGTFF